MIDKDWTKLNRKTVGKIQRWVNSSVYQHVANESDARMVWKILQELYKKKQKKEWIEQNFSFKEVHVSTLVLDHLNTFQGIVNQFFGMNMELDDEILALCLIGSLLGSWETLVVSLCSFASCCKLTLNMVKENILSE